MKSAIVFLHGITSSSAGWAFQVAHFQPTHLALAWNAPGYGGRKPEGTFSFEGLAERLANDMDAFGIAEAVLVGHSFGGMVAQQFVRDFPRRVAGLALVNTSPAFGNPEGEFQKRFIADRLAPLDRGEGMAGMAGEAVGRMAGGDADPEGLGLARRVMGEVSEASYRAAVALLPTFDLRSALAGISVPALVLAGERDTLSPAPMMQRMAQRIPGAAYREFPGAGHLLPFERPAAFNAAVETFLAAGKMNAR